jgi:hypothetical protein
LSAPYSNAAFNAPVIHAMLKKTCFKFKCYKPIAPFLLFGVIKYFLIRIAAYYSSARIAAKA